MLNEAKKATELETAKWLWATRHLDCNEAYTVAADREMPQVGDVVAVRVTKIGKHTRLYDHGESRLRLYEDDLLVGVLGERYATDAFEAELDGLDDLHVLTAAGMFGTVRSRHHDYSRPTEVEFVGYVRQDGERVNLIDRLFVPTHSRTLIHDIIFVVGSGMNSGKTTVAAKLVHGLTRQGQRVAACKLTGSVSHRDLNELRATGAVFTTDFSDYGFPSTYRLDEETLTSLFYTMMTDCESAEPDLIIVELADGVLQRETEMLLQSAEIRQHLGGVMLAACDSLSALGGIDFLHDCDHKIVAVSGMVTSAPLFVRELTGRTSVPVLPSTDSGAPLAQALLNQLEG